MFEFLVPYLEISLPLSLLILVLIYTKPFFNKRYAAKTGYYIWLIIALRLLLPFDISLPSVEQKPVQISLPDMVVYQQTDIVHSGEVIVENNSVQEPVLNEKPVQNSTVPGRTVTQPAQSVVVQKTITVADILSVVWLAGIFILGLYFAIQYWLAINYYRSCSVTDYYSQALLADLRNELGIKKKLAVYRCGCVTSPVIVGVFEGRIYLPDFPIETDILEMMLRHELIHYKRKDIAYKLLMLITCCVHWFNPAVWMMAKQAGADIEVACDDEVVKGKDKRFKQLYSDSIMSVIRLGNRTRPVLSTGFANDKNTLVTRFKNIYDTTVKKGGKPRIAIALAICVMCSTLVACNTQGKNPAKPTEVPPQAMEFMKIYSSGTASDNYFSKDMYAVGFEYLLHKDLLKEEYCSYYRKTGELSHYSVPWKTLMDIYQFTMADKMPDDWFGDVTILDPVGFALDFVQYEVDFDIQSIEYEDDHRMTVITDRYYDGTLYDTATFKFEKQIVETVPADLTSLYNVGDEIWRIKFVDCQVIERPVDVQTVKISTKDEFLAFIDDINTNGYRRWGYTYLLTADIDFGGEEIDQIGTLPDNLVAGQLVNYGGFATTFDGQGHTLSNLVIKYPDDEKYTRGGTGIGLFPVLNPGAVIKNLNVENITVQPSGEKRGVNVGALAGICYGIIGNCHISGNVKGAQAIGGLVGYASSHAVITNCSADVIVDGHREVGGFAGLIGSNAVVSDCISKGKAIGTPDYDNTTHSIDKPVWRIGGFAGSVISGTVIDCHSDARLEILDTARNVGAFSATCESSVMTGCTYSKSKAGNWEPVDYVSNPTDYPAGVTAIK